MVRTLPIYSGPGMPEIEPQDEIKWWLSFSYHYDLSLPGKYRVKINMKVPRLDGKGDADMPFHQILVEVLPAGEKVN